MIDYWCNCFLPSRRALWDAAVGEQGLSIKTRRDGGDGFAEPAEMVARMDELGIATLLLPTAEIPEHADAFAYERYASQPEEARDAGRQPRRVREEPGPDLGPDRRPVGGDRAKRDVEHLPELDVGRQRPANHGDQHLGR